MIELRWLRMKAEDIVELYPPDEGETSPAIPDHVPGYVRILQLRDTSSDVRALWENVPILDCDAVKTQTHTP